MTDKTIRTCYYTGEIKDHDCASAGKVVQLVVASDGRSEWVSCPFCMVEDLWPMLVARLSKRKAVNSASTMSTPVNNP